MKTHDKGSLLAGAIALLPGVAVISYAIQHIILAINEYMTNGMPWDTSLNGMLVQSVIGLILIFPAIITFVAAYLQAESNTLGYKISFVLAIGFLCGLVLNFGKPSLLLFCMISSICATLIGLEQSRKNRSTQFAPAVTEKVVLLFLRLTSLITVFVLIGIISYIAIRGSQFLNWGFISGDSIGYVEIAKRIALSEPDIGGIRNQILGSLIIVGYCEAIAIPLGLGAAIYLSEYAPQNRFVETLRFFIETLAGAPSVIIGLFGWTYFCNTLGMGQSTAAAGLALVIMILPWNIRIAEEAIRAVPQAYREAAYALGTTKWQAIRKTVLAPSSPSVITGVLLGFGAAIGETAVLAFTAGGMGVSELPEWISPIGGKKQQMPVLANWIYGAYKGVRIYDMNIPINESIVWQQANVAYAGALVLVIICLIISVGALLLRNYLAKKTRGN